MECMTSLLQTISNTNTISIKTCKKRNHRFNCDGGDEVFGGYNRHGLSSVLDLINKTPLILRKIGKHALNKRLTRDLIANPLFGNTTLI